MNEEGLTVFCASGDPNAPDALPEGLWGGYCNHQCSYLACSISTTPMTMVVSRLQLFCSLSGIAPTSLRSR